MQKVGRSSLGQRQQAIRDQSLETDVKEPNQFNVGWGVVLVLCYGVGAVGKCQVV